MLSRIMIVVVVVDVVNLQLCMKCELLEVIVRQRGRSIVTL